MFSTPKLITLNRTLAVHLRSVIVKVSSFTGLWQDGFRDEVKYNITAIHFPESVWVPSDDQPVISFKKTAIVSEQDVKC